MTEDPLAARIQKWDQKLLEAHEILRYLHEEFDYFYKALQQIKSEGEESG